MVSNELPGTRFDVKLWAESDEIWTGTIKDQDGNAVDLTGVQFAMLIKLDVEDEDEEAVGEGRVEALEDTGEIRITVDRDQLDGEEYEYMAKARFPDDYAVEALREKALPFLWGRLSVYVDAARQVG